MATTTVRTVTPVANGVDKAATKQTSDKAATKQTSDMATLMAEIERLKAANAALAAKATARATLSLKVTEKGAVSLYGLGRFPATFYAGQWERILGAAKDIEAFIKANADKVTRKENE